MESQSQSANQRFEKNKRRKFDRAARLNRILSREPHILRDALYTSLVVLLYNVRLSTSRTENSKPISHHSLWSPGRDVETIPVLQKVVRPRRRAPVDVAVCSESLAEPPSRRRITSCYLPDRPWPRIAVSLELGFESGVTSLSMLAPPFPRSHLGRASLGQTCRCPYTVCARVLIAGMYP